jgi:hypothetical protein
MAQLDRATVCGTVGRRFESSWAHFYFSFSWAKRRRVFLIELSGCWDLRRGGRVVEGARLESVCRFTPTEGSNPSLSATRSRASKIAHGGQAFS